MTRTEAIAAFFRTNPTVTLVCTGFGHGYGKAKFNSRCKLTRTYIERGDAVRKIDVVTRAGSAHTVYVSNQMFGTLFGSSSHRVEHERGGPLNNPYTDLHYSRWTRWTGVEQVETWIQSAGSVTIEVVNADGQVKTYRRGWNNKWNETQTDNALLATLRRSKRLCLVRITRGAE